MFFYVSRFWRFLGTAAMTPIYREYTGSKATLPTSRVSSSRRFYVLKACNISSSFQTFLFGRFENCPNNLNTQDSQMKNCQIVNISQKLRFWAKFTWKDPKQPKIARNHQKWPHLTEIWSFFVKNLKNITFFKYLLWNTS